MEGKKGLVKLNTQVCVECPGISWTEGGGQYIQLFRKSRQAGDKGHDVLGQVKT